MSNSLIDLRDEILAITNIPEGSLSSFGPSAWEIAELGMFNIGVLTQAAGIIIEQGKEPEPAKRSEDLAVKLGAIVLPALNHVGSLTDGPSNKLMSDIGGRLFGECFQILRGMNSHRRYPRLSTADDLIQARSVDTTIAEHAADYLISDQGGYLLESVNDRSTGCPMRRMYSDDSTTSYFDQLATYAIREYVDPASPFFGLGYYGIAHSIVMRCQPNELTDPLRLSDPEAYFRTLNEWDPGQHTEFHWQLPELS